MIKLQPIHAAVLTLDNGQPIHVERIGRGMYSTAWKNGTAVYIQTHEDDAAKEMLCQIHDTPHLPTVERIHSDSDTSIYNWYKMPLYQKLTSAHKRAWTDYRALQKLRIKASQTANFAWAKNLQCDSVNNEFLELVKQSPLAAQYEAPIEALTEWCASYSQSWLIEELQARNCAVDANGDLILLDPIFDLQIIRDQQDAAMKRHRGY